MTCTIKNCSLNAWSKLYCSRHLKYLRLYGNPEHSEAIARIENPEVYHVWRTMRNRCYTPKNQMYAHYGARGIIVCDRWRYSFAKFLEDMGKRPSSKHSLDRINNNGNYEPSNCRWATRHQQIANRSITNKTVGVCFTNQYKKWEAILNIDKKCVYRKVFKTEQEAIMARKAAELKWKVQVA